MPPTPPPRPDDVVAPRSATARRTRGLKGRVRAPGDKSISHRALILNALATGEARIQRLLESEDVLAVARALEALGARIVRADDGAWRVTGVGANGFITPQDALDLGNSGTGARLLMGALAGHAASATIVGDESLSRRPMERVLSPLRAMGAHCASDSGGLPATVSGARPLTAIAWDSPVASAQVKTAILLAGLAADGATSVVEPSLSRDHTERMLPGFGGSVASRQRDDGRVEHVVAGPQALHARDVVVPGDPSSAAFLLAAGLIAPDSAVTVTDVMDNPTRDGFRRAAAAMGASLASTPADADAAWTAGETQRSWTAQTSQLIAADPDPGHAASYIDEVPILAVLAACAQGTTRFRGVGDLRAKESDRIAATAALLRVNGVEVEDFDDGLAVHGRGPGGVPGGGAVTTYGDHRIAMSALVLGLAAQAPVTVDDVSMIATSYPGFFNDVIALGADLTRAGG